MAQPKPNQPPRSYTTLPYTQIKLSHHPPTSPTPTPIIILTLHRPGFRNAFTNKMMLELEQVFGMLSSDDRVRCIVVTGYGQYFCAGADLEEGFGNEEGDDVESHRDGGGRVALAIHNCKKPVIAAINGAAVGVGITMTLPMSIRIAAEGSKIGFVFARRGIVMEAASSFFLPRLVGHSRAMHLITTGSVYPASSPLLSSLFSELLPSPNQVLPRALELASEIVNNTSLVSFAMMRDLLYRGPASAEETHLLDSRVIYDMFSGSDNKEGVDAFLGKRDVRFTGTVEKDAPRAWPWWDEVDVKGKGQGKETVKAKL